VKIFTTCYDVARSEREVPFQKSRLTTGFANLPQIRLATASP